MLTNFIFSIWTFFFVPFGPHPQVAQQIVTIQAAPSSGGATPTFIQAPVGTSTGATPATSAFVSNVTPSSFIIVNIEVTATQTVTGVTDTRGNTFAMVSGTCTTGAQQVEVWWAQNSSSAASADTISVSWGGLVGGIIIYPIEFSGIATSSPVDGSAVCGSGSSATSPMSSGNTASPATSNELLIGEGRLDNVGTTLTAANGGTAFGTAGGNDQGWYKVVSAADAVKINTTTTGQPFAVVGVLFKHQ
jgi:hypothetical protein